MFRNIGFLTLGLVAITNLNAGNIPIGGVNGLTAGTVNETTTATQGGGGLFGEMPYSFTVGQNTSSTSALPAPGTSLSGGGVTFQMINDSANPTAGVWAGTNDGGGNNINPATVTNTFTIPMGIFGVSNVYTMLNDEYGINGAENTSVTFNFGATGTSGSETFVLVNGTVIRDSFDCTAGTGLAACDTALGGTGAFNLDTSDMYGIGGNNLGAISPTALANVTAFNVYSGTYMDKPTGALPYVNTSGSLNLDAQDFYLGAAFSTPTTELYDVVISDSQEGLFQSRDELSAITVSAVPEPSTILLFVAGLGMIGCGCRRRKSAPIKILS